MYQFNKYISIIPIVAILLFSCNKKKVEEDPNVFYTCSMDPQVMEKRSGKCPICKMELTRTVISPEADKESIRLSETQVRLGNIKAQTVKVGTVGEGLHLRGTVVPDEKKVNVVSSRVSGRVDKLYFKNVGDRISKGDLVYEIYSEELQAAIRQYLLLREKAQQLQGASVNYKEMLRSAKDKLIVWGLSDSQISHLTQASASSLVGFYSKVNGVIEEVSVLEGSYVNEGSSILKVADYTSLWVEAEAYPQDVKFMKPGLSVKVILEAFPNEVIDGKLGFENPELESKSRISLVRVEFMNNEGRYKPGMRATVTAFSDEKKTITVPEEAILYQPEMSTVWVATGEGIFKPRMVETGIVNNGTVEIKSGLAVGDSVVTSGVYLIDSEYKLRKGSGGMPEMDHGKGAEKDKPGAPVHQH